VQPPGHNPGAGVSAALRYRPHARKGEFRFISCYIGLENGALLLQGLLHRDIKPQNLLLVTDAPFRYPERSFSSPSLSLMTANRAHAPHLWPPTREACVATCITEPVSPCIGSADGPLACLQRSSEGGRNRFPLTKHTESDAISGGCARAPTTCLVPRNSLFCSEPAAEAARFPRLPQHSSTKATLRVSALCFTKPYPVSHASAVAVGTVAFPAGTPSPVKHLTAPTSPSILLIPTLKIADFGLSRSFRLPLLEVRSVVHDRRSVLYFLVSFAAVHTRGCHTVVPEPLSCC